MTPENWISIVGIAVGAFVAIGLAIATAVGGVLAWFVQRGLTTLHEIREELTSIGTKLTESHVRAEHTNARIDEHAAILGEHADKIAEHGNEISLIKSKVRVP